MPKWEYRIMEIEQAGLRLNLLSVDGKTIEHSGRSQLPFYSDGQLDLHACLNAAGQEGWEMLGCSPAKATGVEQNFIVFLIFLKRMISSD